MITRLKYLRKNILKLSQKEFGEKIDLKQTSYSEIENLRSSLTDRNLKLICQTFNVNEDWLRNGVEPIFKEDNKEDDSHIKDLIKKYNINQDGIDIVKRLANLDKTLRNNILDFMFDMVRENIDKIDANKLKEVLPKSINDETSITSTVDEPDNIVSIEEVHEIIKVKLYDMPVSAGTGMWLDDYSYYDFIEVDLQECPEAKKSDFALRVRGDSMEPRFYDGDIVYIKEQPAVENGQIGVFVYDNEGYLKKYSVEEDGHYLVSLNEKYEPIKLDPNLSFKCCGLVL